MQHTKNFIFLSLILVGLLAKEAHAQVQQNRLRNTLTGSDICLDIISDGKNNRLTMAKCGNLPGQRWSMTANEKNPQVYRLQTPLTGIDQCLTLINDGKTNQVVMAKCNNLPEQFWSVIPSETTPGYSGYYLLKSQVPGTNNCLNIINDGKNNQLTMVNCNNVSGQSWRITKTP